MVRRERHLFADPKLGVQKKEKRRDLQNLVADRMVTRPREHETTLRLSAVECLGRSLAIAVQRWKQEATTTPLGKQSFFLIQRIFDYALLSWEALSTLHVLERSCSAIDSDGSPVEVCLSLLDHVGGEDPSFQIQERRLARLLAIAVAVQQWKEAKQTNGLSYMLLKLGTEILETQLWFQMGAVSLQEDVFETIEYRERQWFVLEYRRQGVVASRGGVLAPHGRYHGVEPPYDLHQMQIDLHRLADLHQMPQYHLIDLDVMPQYDLVEQAHLIPIDQLVQQHGQMVQQNDKAVQQNGKRIMEQLRALRQQGAQQKWTEIKRDIDANFGASWDRLPSEVRLDIRSLLKRDDPGDPDPYCRDDEKNEDPTHQSADHISRSSPAEPGREAHGPVPRDCYDPLVLRFWPAASSDETQLGPRSSSSDENVS